MQTMLKDHQESTFLRHEACPDCGSSDALGVYDDNHTFCFACHTHTQDAESSETTDATTAKSLQNTGSEVTKDLLTGQVQALQVED